MCFINSFVVVGAFWLHSGFLPTHIYSQIFTYCTEGMQFSSDLFSLFSIVYQFDAMQVKNRFNVANSSILLFVLFPLLLLTFILYAVHWAMARSSAHALFFNHKHFSFVVNWSAWAIWYLAFCSCCETEWRERYLIYLKLVACYIAKSTENILSNSIFALKELRWVAFNGLA